MGERGDHKGKSDEAILDEFSYSRGWTLHCGTGEPWMGFEQEVMWISIYRSDYYVEWVGVENTGI